MTRKDVYEFVKEYVSPKLITNLYLGTEDRVSGDSIIYYSPLRELERTPSLVVNNEKGIHDFGTGEHYDVISFVGALFKISYWEATKKIIVDLQLDINEIKEKNNLLLVAKPSIEIPKFELVAGNKPKEIYCYFDCMEFLNKPQDHFELAGIKKRIINNNFTIYKDKEEIEQEILRGKTCIPGAIKGNAKENWKMQQLFMLDFDNKNKEEILTIQDRRHVKEGQVLKFCDENNILPTFVYNTFSHIEQQHKFRLVYIMEEPIKDIQIAKQIPTYLIEKLKQFNPDTSKRGLSDMFFAGKNICYDGDNYYKINKIKNNPS